MQLWFSGLGQQAVWDAHRWAKEDKWGALGKVSADRLEWVSRLRPREGGAWAEYGSISELRRPSWQFEEYKWLELSWQTAREKSTESCWDLLAPSAQQELVLAVRKLLEVRKRVTRKERSHTKMEIVLALNSQSGKTSQCTGTGFSTER